GYQFKLAADPLEVSRSSNTYLIPIEGIINLDIFPMMSRDQNRMRIAAKGPSGADASIVIADHLIVNRVDYVVAAHSLPDNVQLSQNYPNPFNPSTNIAYEIPQNLSDGVNVQLVLFNLLGQKVRTLVNERNYPGQFRVSWNGTDDRGVGVATGVYLYRLVVGNEIQTRRLMFLK
ncbi:MAG: T9SS type A sorting domain-containing protein, partial [bacterium]